MRSLALSLNDVGIGVLGPERRAEQAVRGPATVGASAVTLAEFVEAPHGSEASDHGEGDRGLTGTTG
jgi:hypothetical protein